MSPGLCRAEAEMAYQIEKAKQEQQVRTKQEPGASMLVQGAEMP